MSIYGEVVQALALVAIISIEAFLLYSVRRGLSWGRVVVPSLLDSLTRPPPRPRTFIVRPPAPPVSEGTAGGPGGASAAAGAAALDYPQQRAASSAAVAARSKRAVIVSAAAAVIREIMPAVPVEMAKELARQAVRDPDMAAPLFVKMAARRGVDIPVDGVRAFLSGDIPPEMVLEALAASSAGDGVMMHG